MSTVLHPLLLDSGEIFNKKGEVEAWITMPSFKQP